MSHPLSLLPTDLQEDLGQQSCPEADGLHVCVHGQGTGKHPGTVCTDSAYEKSWGKEDKLFLNRKNKTH